MGQLCQYLLYGIRANPFVQLISRAYLAIAEKYIISSGDKGRQRT